MRVELAPALSESNLEIHSQCENIDHVPPGLYTCCLQPGVHFPTAPPGVNTTRLPPGLELPVVLAKGTSECGASSTDLPSSSSEVDLLEIIEESDSAECNDCYKHTLAMRNIPKSFTRIALLTLLDNRGFHGAYRLAYLPCDYTSGLSVGYAVTVSFRSREEAVRFKRVFQGFDDWTLDGTGTTCRVEWCENADDFDGQVKRQRNSPVMHPSVPGEFRAIVCENGTRVAFPKPTRQIKKTQIKTLLD